MEQKKEEVLTITLRGTTMKIQLTGEPKDIMLDLLKGGKHSLYFNMGILKVEKTIQELLARGLESIKKEKAARITFEEEASNRVIH